LFATAAGEQPHLDFYAAGGLKRYCTQSASTFEMCVAVITECLGRAGGLAGRRHRADQCRQSGRVHRLQLAQQVLRLAGSRSKIVFRPLPGDDPKQWQPDISKARALLGWGPMTPLEEGLKATLSYFRRLLAT